MKVKDIMTKSVKTVRMTSNLKQVRELIYETGMSHLIVTDAVGIYKGIISRNDLLEKLSSLMLQTSGKKYTNLELERLKAGDIMTSSTVNIAPDDSLHYATEILLQKKFHALPVIKNYRAVGVVTQHDLLKSYYESTAYTQTANYE